MYNDSRTIVEDSQVGSLNVVFACDEAYAMPLATALRSLVDSHRGNTPLSIFVLSNGFSEVLRRKVADSIVGDKVSMYWVPIDLSAYQHFSTLPYTSQMTYARLQMPFLLPSTISRVLYLDADLLVLDDVEKILKIDLEGKILGAVIDPLDSRIKTNAHGFEDVPRVRDYFNAGVLVVDLHQWRNLKVSERAMNLLETNPALRFADQDALNVVCDGAWKSLSSRWNFQEGKEKRIVRMEESERPAIVHFVMAAKPWNPRLKNVNAKFFDSYRSRTRFARGPGERVVDGMHWSWRSLKDFVKERIPSEYLHRWRSAQVPRV